jgi:hypothetical protein
MIDNTGRSSQHPVQPAETAQVSTAIRIFEPHTMPISIPISLREANDPAGGNKWAGARLVAPVGEPDPTRRVHLVRALIQAARQEPAIAFMELLAPALNHLPSAALTEIAGNMTNVADVQASNVPGLNFPVPGRRPGTPDLRDGPSTRRGRHDHDGDLRRGVLSRVQHRPRQHHRRPGIRALPARGVSTRC